MTASILCSFLNAGSSGEEVAARLTDDIADHHNSHGIPFWYSVGCTLENLFEFFFAETIFFAAEMAANFRPVILLNQLRQLLSAQTDHSPLDRSLLQSQW